MSDQNLALRWNVNPKVTTAIRIVFLSFYLIHISLYAYFYRLDLLKESVVYLTSWGYWMTFAYLCLVLTFWNESQISDKHSKFLFVVLIINIIITLGYWALIHFFLGDLHGFKKFHFYVTHLLPFLVSSFDFLSNKINIAKYHFTEMLIILFSYFFINFCIVKYTGKPIYSILNWKDYISALFVAFAFGVGLLSGFFVLKINNQKFIHFKIIEDDFEYYYYKLTPLV